MTWELKCDKCGNPCKGKFYVLLERFVGFHGVATNKGQWCPECIKKALEID